MIKISLRHGFRDQVAKGNSTKVVRLFQYYVEDWGEIAGRGVDDLHDFGGRGLLLQGFVTLGGAFS